MATPAPDAGWAHRLERLAHWVPGLGPYQDREGLREADRQVRGALAERLAGLACELEAAIRSATQAGRLEPVAELDRIGRLFQTQADRARYAGYGFAGVFDLRKIRERELAALHDYDLRLFEALPRLQERVRALADAAERVAWFPQAAQAAEEALRDVERMLDARDRVARGL
jgi:hypothetical protein